MNNFREALGQFREAMRQEGERSENPGLRAILERRPRRRQWAMAAWAAAAVAVLALGAIPVYENAARESARQRELDQALADTLLMEQVNAGLSRSVPRAMTPLVDWAPKGQK